MKLYLEIDADSLIYAAAFAAQKMEKGEIVELKEPIVAISALKNICATINAAALLDMNDYTEVQEKYYLTAPDIKKNFRWHIDNEYKANRKKMKKPEYYNLCRDWLKSNKTCFEVEGTEAEDMAANQHVMNALREKHSWLVGIDKDLNNVPDLNENCFHYNWRNQTATHITEEDATKHFYFQLLTGDAIDNIKGLKGVGPVGASNILKQDKFNEIELWERVKFIYKFLENIDEEEILKRAQLLWIRHRPNEAWEPPYEELDYE